MSRPAYCGQMSAECDQAIAFGLVSDWLRPVRRRSLDCHACVTNLKNKPYAQEFSSPGLLVLKFPNEKTT